MRRAFLVLLVLAVPVMACGQGLDWQPCWQRSVPESYFMARPTLRLTPYDSYEIRRLIEYRDLVRRVEAAERAQAEIERERRAQADRIRAWIFGIPVWLR